MPCRCWIDTLQVCFGDLQRTSHGNPDMDLRLEYVDIRDGRGPFTDSSFDVLWRLASYAVTGDFPSAVVVLHKKSSETRFRI